MWKEAIMDKKDFHELMVARARYSEIRLRASLDTVNKITVRKHPEKDWWETVSEHDYDVMINACNEMLVLLEDLKYIGKIV